MINKIKQIINSSKTVAVLCHVNADGDALCSSYSMAEVLSQMGKDVVCILEENPGNKYSFLEGEYLIFDKSQEYMFDLAVAVDCGDDSRLGERTCIFNNAKHTINIDHHKTNNNFADVNIVKPNYCAAAEVLAELFLQMDIKLSDNIARLLYIGIMSDSGCLKYSSTSPSTLRTVADLMEYDFDHAEMIRLLFDNKSMELTRLTGHVMDKVECFYNGKIAIICTDTKLLKRYNVEHSDAADLINIPRSISGCEIAVEVKERDGIVRVSLRSNGIAEVDKIAGKFGGGGHLRAAGATMTNMTLDDAKKAILDASIEELKRCGI